MKRSKAGIVLMVIGVILVIMAPVWKWGIGPTLAKIPDDVNATSKYLGTLKLFVDPNSLTLLPPEMAVTVPLTITRVDTSVPEKGSGSVAVIKETAEAKGPGGKDFLTYTKYFAMDRRNAEAVANYAPLQGTEGYQNRKNLTVLFPLGVQKKTYMIWDDETGKSGPVEFEKEEKLKGKTSGETTVYLFKGEPVETPMVVAPLGLPKSVTGAQAKQLSGNPDLPVVDTQEYPISYLKSTAATVVPEPKTGSIVDLRGYQDTYSIDATGIGLGKIKLATISYNQEKANVRELIDNAHKYFGLLDLNSMWLPLIFLVVGLLILIVGLILFLRKKPA